MDSVSVVIPVRNDARLLERCLQALAAQTVPPDEIIIVDNGSTDDSAAIARSFGARVVHEPQVGIPAAAATGYDSARASIIARCDADTIVGSDWIEKILSAFAERPDAAAVTGWGVFYDVPPLLGRVLCGFYLGSYYALGGLAAAHHVLWGSSMAIRRSAWENVSARVHRDNQEIHDDMDLALVLGAGAQIALVTDLQVEVSGRSVHLGPQWRRRLARAFTTLSLNWETKPPWRRWADRVRGERFQR